MEAPVAAVAIVVELELIEELGEVIQTCPPEKRYPDFPLGLFPPC